MHALLVRHARCPSCGPLLAGRTAGIELDEAGRRQAVALAASLGGQPLAAVYTSPLPRAVQTAEPIAAAHGIPVTPLQEFLELDYGEWTGCTFAQLEGDARWETWNRARSMTAPPGGESAQAVQTRAVAALLRLRERHGAERVAIVTHAEVVRTVVAWCLGTPLDLCLRIEVAPASVTRLAWHADDVRVVGLNSTGEAGP